jgi:hypothetical protein
MYRLAKTNVPLSQRDEHETTLIGLTIATNAFTDYVRSGILVLSGLIALSAPAFAQSPAAPNASPTNLDILSRDPNQWVMAPHRPRGISQSAGLRNKEVAQCPFYANTSGQLSVP